MINLSYSFIVALSALNILSGELSSKNLDILDKILDVDIRRLQKGVHYGLSKSGNHSMFFAIFNIYANDFLKVDRSKQINEWLKFNCESINVNGFWGKKTSMDYLQFQNGYHQYEILEYLKFDKISWDIAAKKTLLLSDKIGHFAPWPGGGACYDYDAIFMLTSKFVVNLVEGCSQKTLDTILNEQNSDGGFVNLNI